MHSPEYKELMEAYIALAKRVQALESAGVGVKVKKKCYTKTEKKKIQITNGRMGPMSRRLLNMLTRSGRSSRNLTIEEHEEIQRIVKAEGTGKLKEQVELLERFYKYCWKRGSNDICLWTTDLTTLLNNRSKYIDRAESFLANKPTRQHVRIATEPTFTEPAYNWREWVIETYGEDTEGLKWPSVLPWMKKEICEHFNKG